MNEHVVFDSAGEHGGFCQLMVSQGGLGAGFSFRILGPGVCSEPFQLDEDDLETFLGVVIPVQVQGAIEELLTASLSAAAAKAVGADTVRLKQEVAALHEGMEVLNKGNLKVVLELETSRTELRWARDEVEQLEALLRRIQEVLDESNR